MPHHSQVIGFGELIYDHVFIKRENSITYSGSHGGGSVFNLLANAASLGDKVIATGVGGDDIYGNFAKEELAALSVNSSCINLVSNKRTRIIFETLTPSNAESLPGTDTIHDFSATCVVCGYKPLDSSLARTSHRHFTSSGYIPVEFFCVDSLTKDRIQLAREFRSQGTRTVLDIGRIGHLRYLPATQIIAALQNFDVLLAPDVVIRSIANRCGFTSISDFCLNGPQLVFASSGAQGLSFYDGTCKSQAKEVKFSAPNVHYVVDAAGAGDAFLSRVVHGFLKSVAPSCPLSCLSHEDICSLTSNAISTLDEVLGAYGARGHILTAKNKELLQLPITSRWIDKTVNQINCERDKAMPCPFCGGNSNRGIDSVRRSTAKIGAKGNVSLLLRRTFLAAERKEALLQCKTILQERGTAYVVGTGGSYPVAMFLSHVIGKHSELFCQPILPFDYVRLARKTDYVIIVSYSGSTIDCREAIERAKALGVKKIVLLTGNPQPKLQNELRLSQEDIVISYGRATKDGKTHPLEKGFVSIAGTVAPCALWTAAATSSVEMAHLFSDLEDWQNLNLDKLRNDAAQLIAGTKPTSVLAFGGGLAWAALLDFESKFVEGDLGKVQIHEVKDFSHGRFMSVMAPTESSPVVFFSIGDYHPYEIALCKTLQKSRPVVVIKSDHQGMVGALELLVKVQFLVQICGETLGKDISRPANIPSAGLRFYKWPKLSN